MRANSLIFLTVLLEGATGLRSSHMVEPVVEAKPAAPVFYTVIMGNLAYRHQVSLWLSSLRLVGKFKGEAVIVTDGPVCLAKTLTEAKLLGPLITMNEAVSIFGPAEGYTGNIHLVKRPIARSINKMKLEKARGWLNVAVAGIPHPVSSIIYTDEDVVMAKDITSFVSVIRGLEQQGHTLALFRDTGKSAGELHTGVVAMFPSKATDVCLQAWGKKLTGVQIGSNGATLNVEGENEQEISDQDIEEGVVLDEEYLAMGPDQQALGSTKQCKASAGHAGVKILPKEFFWLPTPSGLRKGRQTEFVHFTNTGRWKLISHTTIRAYLQKIGIPDNIDPTGSLHDKECAIPAGGTLADVAKAPKNYGR